ncbi:MAG: hypothetical protein ACI9LU_002459, partial [Polaribacter sp.]
VLLLSFSVIALPARLYHVVDSEQPGELMSRNLHHEEGLLIQISSRLCNTSSYTALRWNINGVTH